eukprot:SAG22_NODE_8283_length_667_cov_1.529930_1_plen_84_part_00
MSTNYASVGAVAAAKERGKVTKYHTLAEALGFVFEPFGVETWGAWGPGATQVLHQLVAGGGAPTRPTARALARWGLTAGFSPP